MTIPGAGGPPRERGAELLQEFLWSVAGMPEEEAAEIAGVSVATLNRWRRSGSQRLRKDIRRRLIRHLRQEAEAADAERQAA